MFHLTSFERAHVPYMVLLKARLSLHPTALSIASLIPPTLVETFDKALMQGAWNLISTECSGQCALPKKGSFLESSSGITSINCCETPSLR